MERLFLLLLLFLSPFLTHAQVILTEVGPTNLFQVEDEDGDYPDWIELFNSGTEDVNLLGLQLSDDEEPKWRFPDYVLGAGERVLVYASGKDKGGFGQQKIDHWETAINDNDQWAYYAERDAPPADWNQLAFDVSQWASAPGGFGYGDDDDNTITPDSSLVVYYRRNFDISDLSAIDSILLSMDYDDGFVAYLNGIEIARSYNMPDGVIDHTTVAEPDHEAQVYWGGLPDIYPVSKEQLQSLLQVGNNVLAIELHSIALPSSDLTGRTWLHMGIATEDQFFGPNPDFFPNLILTLFHTGFKIGFGETVRLFDDSDDVIDEIEIPYLLPGHSIMRSNDVDSWCITSSVTPEEPNGNDCLVAYASKPSISPVAGIYPNAVEVSLDGVNVRYTIDGSDPVDTSTLYTGPFMVSGPTVVRARSFESGFLPGETATASYLIGIESELPVLSISAKHGDLFWDENGGLAVYDDYNSGRRAPAHIEFIDKSKALAFSENASLRPVGGYSIAFDQKSMQFEFDEEYGARDEVEYVLFERDKPNITSIREFRVRNMDDDWNSTRIRDVIANQLTLPTKCAATGYQHMAVYINGEYWGHYGGREVTNEYYVRDNHGADEDEVEQIFSSYFEDDHYLADEGTADDFFDMSDYIINHDMSDSLEFAKVAERIDWENWVDYFAAEMYLGNGDWFSSMYFNNTRLYRAPDLRWRFIIFDVTFAQGNGVDDDVNILDQALANPAQQNRYTDMMNSLLANDKFRNYFINRFADLINEYWTPAKAGAFIDENADEIASEIERQNARWGSGDSLNWREEIHDLKEFHIVRRVYQRNHIEEYFGLTDQVDLTLRVEPAEAGVIHINTIVPSRFPWAGIYFEGNPITITAVPNPGYSFDHWEENIPGGLLDQSFTVDLSSFADITAHFTGTSQPDSLEITEINYDSDPGRNTGDWVEIRNNAATPVDLTHYVLQDREWYNAFSIPAGTVLQSGERVVIAENLNDFKSFNPEVENVVGSTYFKFDNDGERIHISNRTKQDRTDVTYSNEMPWPCTPAGYGRTLERRIGSSDPNDAASWFDGCIGGSPGTPYFICTDAVLISEINYNSSDDLDAGDWFEIRNMTFGSIDLSGWSIRDDDNDHIFEIPVGVVLDPHEIIVFCEEEDKFVTEHPFISNYISGLDFGFGSGGDVIRLYDADGNIVMSVCYDDTSPWPTEADGDGYTLELLDPTGNLNSGENWFAGCEGGSPGRPYDPDCLEVAVDDPTKTENLFISPNPVTEILNIAFEHETNGTISLTDVMGKRLIQARVNGLQYQMKFENIPDGMYWITLESKEGRISKKVIKN